MIVKNVNRIKSWITLSVDMSVKIHKNIVGVKKVWNPAKCSGENGKYVWSINDDSIVTCDEIIETTKDVPTKSASTEAILTKCTSKNSYILLTFLLITRALLIVPANTWLVN